MYGVKLYPDVSGCVHKPKVIMGVWQCGTCGRPLDLVETESGPRLKARMPKVAP